MSDNYPTADFSINTMRDDIDDAVAIRVCVVCGADAHDFKNQLSECEYNMSGLCQKCQDEVFNEGEF